MIGALSLCSPQMAMDPMPMSESAPLVRDHAAEFHGIQGWPATPKLVPTVIVCELLPPLYPFALEHMAEQLYLCAFHYSSRVPSGAMGARVLWTCQPMHGIISSLH